MITAPDKADALIAPFIATVRSEAPDYLATSNSGCALHFQHALSRDASDVIVMHPVSIIADCLHFPVNA